MTEQTTIAQLFEKQRESFLSDEFPSAKLRQDRLSRAISLLKENKNRLCQAIHEDFGARAYFHSTVSDILVTLDSLKYCHKYTPRWMLTENRGARFPLNLFGAKAQVFYQPKGVVGIVSPWNFPVQLTFSPLANVLSAGNRAMIKPSELTPATSQLIKTLVEQYFAPEEVTVITGAVDTAVAFTQQPFDHLLFTGAPSVAKHVAHAAADNLVPLTLELGGKCPVIISDDAKLAMAVKRLMSIKVLNAGQICLAPDYVFVKDHHIDHFIEAATRFIESSFTTFSHNDDYTAIINDHNYHRLLQYIEQAKQRNCRVVKLHCANPDPLNKQDRKITPTLIINPDDDLQLMQEEIFGPILPVKTYSTMTDVIQYINERHRPLALYYFGNNTDDINALKQRTTSGGMVVNDLVAHIVQDSMPLGGIGHSGMGAYHGFDGFKEFSHAKAFFKQGWLSTTDFLKPPYKPLTLKIIEKFMG